MPPLHTAFNYLLALFLLCRLLRKALDKITEVKGIRENRRLGLYISVSFSPYLERDWMVSIYKQILHLQTRTDPSPSWGGEFWCLCCSRMPRLCPCGSASQERGGSRCYSIDDQMGVACYILVSNSYQVLGTSYSTHFAHYMYITLESITPTLPKHHSIPPVDTLVTIYDRNWRHSILKSCPTNILHSLGVWQSCNMYKSDGSLHVVHALWYTRFYRSVTLVDPRLYVVLCRRTVTMWRSPVTRWQHGSSPTRRRTGSWRKLSTSIRAQINTTLMTLTQMKAKSE